MSKYLSVFLSLVLFSLPSTLFAEENINVMPTPDWVVKKLINLTPEVPKNEVKDGVHYLLVDTQINVSKQGNRNYFYHYADLITNQNGVADFSQINLNYDPTYQSIALHSLTIWRGGKAIDKTKTSRMSTIQREQDLDKLIYNGENSLHIILDDVRVGDIIEYSYSRIGTNPVYQGIFSYNADMQWSVPVAEYYLRILWNKKIPLQYKLHNSQLQVKTTQLANSTEYIVEDSNLAALSLDEKSPNWFSPYAEIYFSETKNWSDVATWGETLFRPAIKSTAQIESIASDIKLKTSNTEQQIALALQYVQSEIRYLGIEIGENSHRPSNADITLKRRYGDCKDKTVLLTSILRELGVNAYPALVNTYLKKELSTIIPQLSVFDHVIVQVEHNRKTYWLDPTRQYQYGNLTEIYQPDYGYALPLRTKTQQLASMQSDDISIGYKIKETFDLTAKDNSGITYSIESEYQGLDAERQRDRIASKGLKEIQDEYLEYYQDYYPSTTPLDPTEFIDNTEVGKLYSNEKYAIPELWYKNEKKKKYTAKFYTNEITPYLSTPDKKSRSHPLKLAYPVKRQQTIEVKFRDDTWNFDPEEFIENNAFFTYKSKVNYDKETLTLRLDYSYQSNSNFIPAEKLTQYIDAIKRAKNDADYKIFYRFPKEKIATDPVKESLLLMLNKIDPFYAAITAYTLLLILTIILWRVYSSQRPVNAESIYYPVSLPKFIAMWIITYSMYSIYWFYKNWKYIKQRDSSSAMPAARGIFNQFWYYPLYADLRKDNTLREESQHLPGKFIGGLMAIIFFASAVLMNVDIFAAGALVISTVLVLPLANYIHHINKDNQETISFNSKWSFRHYLMSILFLPILLLTIGSDTGLLANEAVISGDKLYRHDLQYMQRKGVIEPNDDIAYFYSDAFLLIRDDGNGFTNRHVFSYWNESGELNLDTAKYEEIKDIEITWAKSGTENTIIKIIRNDDSDFLLYVSRSDSKDKIFVSTLLDKWEKQQAQ